MSRKSDKDDAANTIEQISQLERVQYLSPDTELSIYSDYPLDLLTPILSVRIRGDAAEYKEDTPHKHAEFELISVLRGSATVQFNTSSVHVNTGDTICVKRGVVHSVIPDDRGATELELTHFHHAILFGPTISALSGRNLLPVLGDETFEYTTFDHEDPSAARIIERIHDIYKYMHSSAYGAELRAIAALFDIWSMGIEASVEITEVPLTKQQALDKWRIERATEYIAAHYFEDILLSDISEACEVSDSECCRTFQRALHSSPIDYINRYRIYAAAELMTNDVKNTPMSDIAASVGFNYASYFNKTFKRYLGMTPMQYRKKHNKAELYRKSQQEFRI